VSEETFNGWAIGLCAFMVLVGILATLYSKGYEAGREDHRQEVMQMIVKELERKVAE
jgi:hypothetical protein